MRAKLVENISQFKQGQGSKSALDVGEYRSENQTIKRYLEPTLPEFYMDAFNWIKDCPPLMKDLGVKTIDDMKDLLSLEEDYTLEQNEDLDVEDLEDDYIPGQDKTFFPPEKFLTTWRWNIGKLKDGSKIIYWAVGMTSGYTARKEWIK